MKKIKEYWNKSSIWKQGFILGGMAFSIILIYAITSYMNSTGSDMAGLSFWIPFFFLNVLFDWYNKLKIPISLSLIINLISYYIFGLILSWIIKKITK